MSPVVSLAELDPVFVEVAKALYGDAVDPRQLWVAKNMDAADVHVPGTVKAKKKPVPTADQKTHSNTARALVIGAGPDALATYRAGQLAAKAVRPAPVIAGAKAAGKLKSTGSKAHMVGEFGLQATNLSLGLLAARKLSQAAKKNGQATTVAKLDVPKLKVPKFKFLRPVQHVMTDEQAAAHTATIARATKGGGRLVAGSALAVGALLGHHIGRKSGMKAATGTTPVAKGLLVAKPTTPIAHVRPINSGGAGVGLGRHGRSLTQITPPPKLQPVAKPMPKKIVDNTAGIGKSVEWIGEISKIDTDKRTVFGWCSVSKINGEDVQDLQDDRIDIGEVEKSAYTYVLESRKGGDMHKRVSKGDQVHHTADLIESFVVTPEKLEKMGLPGNALPLGWWIGMKINDDQQWADVKALRRTGFSIHGTGARTVVAA